MFEVRSTADIGLGWFATQDIPPDTVIMDEDLMLRLPRSSAACNLKKALSKLAPLEKEAFHSLSGDTDSDKLWQNCHPLIGPADVLGVSERTEVGIYNQCSRINHSCRPNAVRASENDIMSVVSQKGIKTGQQITISYLTDNFQTVKARLHELRSKNEGAPGLASCWDRGCRCEVCTASSEELKADDKRRNTLASLRARFLSEQGHGFETMNTMIKLMNDEGLYLSLMGMPALMKMITVTTHISVHATTPGEVHAATFIVGVRVKLHSLKAKPELNGRDGTVVLAFDAKSGRVGVALDLDSDNEKKLPLSVKPGNLYIPRSLDHRKFS
jgi:hypothetical protein